MYEQQEDPTNVLKQTNTNEKAEHAKICAHFGIEFTIQDLLSQFGYVQAALKEEGAQFVKDYQSSTDLIAKQNIHRKYLENVNKIIYNAIEEETLSTEDAQKLFEITEQCQALAFLKHSAPDDEITKTVETQLKDFAWQAHFKNNPPPKYEGVKKSGKAIKFFMKHYRNLENVDYVDAGMVQADLRRYDPRLLKSLKNYADYQAVDLSDYIPPAFSPRKSSSLDI